MEPFNPPLWFFYLNPTNQLRYRALYATLPAVFPTYGWTAALRHNTLTSWTFNQAQLPPNPGVPETFWNDLKELQAYTHRASLLWLHDPDNYRFAQQQFQYLTGWAYDPLHSTFTVSSQTLTAEQPPESIYQSYARPMEWFMKTSLVPVLSYIMGITDSLKNDLVWRTLNRQRPYILLNLTSGPSMPPRTFRIMAETIAGLWNGQDLLLEEVGEDPNAERQVSGLQQLAIRYADLVEAARFSVGFIDPSTTSITRRRVGIFPLIHDVAGLDLSRYQIFDSNQVKHPPPQASKHCLLWALECAGLPPQTIQSLASFIPGRLVRLTALRPIFANLDYNIHVEYTTESDPTRSKTLSFTHDPTKGEIYLGLIDNHIFINEPIPVTYLYIDHANSLPPAFHGRTNLARMNHGYPSQYYDTCKYTSFQIINHMYRGTFPHFRRMTYYQVARSYRKLIDIEEFDDQHLEYDLKLSTRAFKQDTPDKCPSIWFADFEAFTGGARHEPYLLCYGQVNRPIKALDCVNALYPAVYNMLDEIGEGIIYFHNLTYDGSFLLNLLPIQQDSLIEYGSNRLLSFKVHGPHGTIEFRDSLAILPFPLRDFPKMLGIPTEKEIMNYNLYTPDTYRALIPLEQAAGSFTIDEYQEAARRAGALRGRKVDMWQYAIYYCQRDVEVLARGYFKMNEMMQQATKQSLWQRLTAPSLAFHSLRLEGVFEGCYELTGAPAFCIRKTAIGGRCMLRRNLKQRVVGPIADFDAVSLYPSAMSLLYTLKGFPKVIGPEHLANWETVHKLWDGFFVEIEILRVERELDFPLITYKENNQRIFCNRPGKMWVNDITLEDLITFHKITYIPLRGYYYDEGKNFKIREVIRRIFDMRLEAKREKQSIEVVYKLLMNSCYGKTIMKPRPHHKNVVSEDELLKQLGSSPFNTVTYEPLSNGNYLLTSLVDVLQNWSIPTLGSHVLAMSKRLVTQVTSLAQDLGIGIYYTDTDSIHIDRDSLEDLATAFRLKYDRELVGKDLCQFHTDFPVTERGMMWSTLFIGVGKKAYIDCLTDGVDKHYHIRLKGIPERSIYKFCEKHNYTPEQLFDLFYSHPDFSATFDICDAKPAFARKSNYIIQSLEHFYRRISFPSLEPVEEGLLVDETQ